MLRPANSGDGFRIITDTNREEERSFLHDLFVQTRHWLKELRKGFWAMICHACRGIGIAPPQGPPPSVLKKFWLVLDTGHQRLVGIRG